MTGRKLGWLSLTLTSVLCFGYFGSIGALAVGIALVLVPLGSLAGNLAIRKKLVLHVDAPASARKGDEAFVTVTLQNPTLLPAICLRAEILAENQLNRQKTQWKQNFWALPGQTRTYRLKLASPYCGRLRLSVTKAKLYDCFGLMGLPCSRGNVAHMVVQPDTFAMEVTMLPVADRTPDSEDYSQQRPGQDLTETYQLREYVPGDSPRQIHWKLTGKFDRLIVRDPALPIARNVLIFWERTGQSESPERVDAQAEAVVSLCRGLLDGGFFFTVGWNDTDRNLCILHEIRSMDALVGVIPRLLRATGGRGGISGTQLLLQTRPDALCSHMVYIGENPPEGLDRLQSFGHVTMLLCGGAEGENAIPFTPENYPGQLAQILL